MGFSRSRVGGGGVVRVVVGGGCLVAVLDLLSVQACWCLLCIHVEFMQSIWDLEISRCHVLQGVIGAVCSCFCGLRCIHVSHCRPLTYLIREVQYIHRIPQMPLGSRLWASMSFTLSCSWIAAGLMDAALQYSPCCVFQSTHKHRAAFPNTVMLCCELSEAWAGGWRLQALWGAALDESLYWDLLRTVWSFFFFQLLWKNRLGWCSTYCWIWCGKWLNLKQLYFQIDVRSGKKSGRQAFMPNVMQVLCWCHNMKTSYKDKWATSNFPYSFLVRGCNKDLA